MPHGRPTAIRAKDKWPIAALVALHVCLGAILFDPKLFTGGDNALYVLLSESLRTTGDGYSTSIEPGPPVPHTVAPPGYPALLTLIGAFFGRHFVLLKLLSLALTAGTVWVFCLFARRRGREWNQYPWFLASFAFAANPLVIDYSRWILSEAPFLFFTALSLFLLERESEQRADRNFWLALAAAVGSFYIRSVGALLLLATSVSYMVRRRWRKVLIHGAAGGGLTIPWLIRNQSVAGTTTSYLEQFALVSIYAPDAGALGFLGTAERLIDNAWMYVTRELPRGLVGSTSPWAEHPAVEAIALLVCVLVLVGLVRSLRKGLRALELYFVLNCAVISLFQRVATDVRYLVPLIPFVLIYAIDGAMVLGNAVQHRIKPLRALPTAVAATLIAVAILSSDVRIHRNIEMLGEYRAGDPYAGYQPKWRRFFEAAEHVRANTPEDAVVTVRKPRLFHLLTGRRTRIFPFTENRDSVLSVLLSTDHVVVDQTTWHTTARYLVPVVAANSDRFQCDFRTEEPHTYVCTVVK